MKGRIPKPPGMRQRRNRTATGALLPSRERSRRNKVPALPPRESRAERWHPMVLRWWREVWQSPMAGEYLGPDVVGGLYGLAELYQLRWTGAPTRIAVVLAEIRQQEVRFGLSPMDRRRLQWEIEKGEQAEERTKTRRQRRDPQSGADPRDVLKVV